MGRRIKKEKNGDKMRFKKTLESWFLISFSYFSFLIFSFSLPSSFLISLHLTGRGKLNRKKKEVK